MKNQSGIRKKEGERSKIKLWKKATINRYIVVNQLKLGQGDKTRKMHLMCNLCTCIYALADNVEGKPGSSICCSNTCPKWSTVDEIMMHFRVNGCAVTHVA